jgi:hypothetical protein
MKLQIPITTFMKFIPKQESVERAYFSISNGSLTYAGIRSYATLSNFLPGSPDMVLGYRDLLNLSYLEKDTTTIEQKDSKIIASDGRTTLEFFAFEPKVIPNKPFTIVPDLTIPESIRIGRSILSMRQKGSISAMYTDETSTYVSAISRSIVYSIREHNVFPVELDLSQFPEILEAIVSSKTAKVGFEKTTMVVRDFVEDMELLASVKFSQPRIMDKVRSTVKSFHTREQEKGIIVSAIVSSQAIRQFTSIVDKLESPTGTKIEFVDNAIILSANEMHGRSVKQKIDAKVSDNKITITTVIPISNAIINFIETSIAHLKQQRSSTELCFTVLPEIQRLLIRPIVNDVVDPDKLVVMI